MLVAGALLEPSIHAMGADLFGMFGQFDWLNLLQSKGSRAIGMLILVWLTIWVIALVYSGYLKSSEFGPIGIRVHPNRQLSHDTIVFHRETVPMAMDSVETKCRFYFNYEDRRGKTRQIPLNKSPLELRLHIRTSTMARTDGTRFGFEPIDAPADSLFLPPPLKVDAEKVHATPTNVREYMELHKLIEDWTDDDEAPIISLSEQNYADLIGARVSFLDGASHALIDARTRNPKSWKTKSLAENRPAVMGTYSVRLHFSKNPLFVLFKHPNRELKMTAWLTVLTSVFSLVMDAWPVTGHDRPERRTEQLQAETIPTKKTALAGPVRLGPTSNANR